MEYRGMSATDPATPPQTDPSRRPVLELTAAEAREFFLKGDSYCTIDLPPYIEFGGLISSVDQAIGGSALRSLTLNPRDFEGLNYVILSNKDGRYAWRPLELIHPAQYVSLVNVITEPSNWATVVDRFRAFRENEKIICLSIPVESQSNETDKAEQVSQWWELIEQQSVQLSLDYGFIALTDVVDCYGAIYTHSIAWALHTKQTAKKFRNDINLVANRIDRHIQDMRYGQTNGIPQGSVLMDLIGEMVLGYADVQLTYKLILAGIKDYRILRYRDDYRIFFNNPKDGETILKCLTEVMIGLGLKLGPAKTGVSSDVIGSSIKPDKLSWIMRKQRDDNLQKRLLIIRDHANEYPNSGSLAVALYEYYKRLSGTTQYDLPMSLVAIVTEIAYGNPRVYPVAAAILSKLISLLGPEYDKSEIVTKVRAKFTQIPNTGHLDIWLQRIAYPFASDMKFDERLCHLVADGNEQLWNNAWIQSQSLLKALDANAIINREKLENLEPIVPIEEIELFESDY